MNKSPAYISHICPEDALALHQLVLKNQEYWGKYFPLTVEKNLTPEKTQSFIAQLDTSEKPCQFLYTIKNNDALIGLIYLKELDWEAKKGELAYAINQEDVGKGYAGAGVKEVISLAFKKYDLRRLEIFTHKINSPSTSLAESCGFTWSETIKNAFTPPGGIPLDMELYLLKNER